MSAQAQKRPEAILAEIDRTRGEMDHTLVEIEQRLTPGQLVDQGLDYLRHSGVKEFADNLGGSVKENPLPIALVGVGLAWLMAAGRRPGASGDGASASGDGASASGRLAERAGGTLDRTKEKIGSAKAQISGGMQSARERASELADGTRQQLDRARGGVDYLMREQPLALGAIGLAIGAVLAAAAPRTEQEDKLMGEASDRAGERAKNAAKEQMDEAAGQAREQLKKAKPQESAKSPAQQQDSSQIHGAGSFRA